MKRNGSSSLIILLVIAILLVSSGIWYWRTHQFSPSPTPIAQTASNWKSYNNSLYDFSFQYPSGLLINRESSSSVILSQNATSTLADEYDLAVVINQNQNNLTPQDYFNGANGDNLYAKAIISTTSLSSFPFPITIFKGSVINGMTTQKVIIMPYLNGYLEVVNNNLDDNTFNTILKSFSFRCVPSKCWGHLGCNYYTCTGGTTKFVY